MADQTAHSAQGEGLVPHETNPTVQKDVEDAMAKAVDDAGEAPSEEQQEETQQELPIQEASQAPADTAETPPAKDEPQAGDLEPPANWSAADQGIFRDVDKATQEWLLARDKAATESYQQQLEAVQPWQQVQQQWDPYFKQLGQPAPQLINGLLQTEMQLRTGTPAQKQEALLGIMRAYGIEVGQEQQQLPEEVSSDPVAQALSARLDEVLRGQRALESQVQTQFGQFEANQLNAQQTALDQFKGATDADGKLLHPYYSEVEPLMNSLAANAGQTTTLQDVYDQACWASPSVRAKLQGAAQAADIVGRKQSAAAKQVASKSVSSSPAGSRTVQVPQGNPNESVLETVEAAVAAHSGAE